MEERSEVEMRIERKRVAELLPAEYNPRVELGPSDPDYERLKHSIEEFSCVRPPVYNAKSGRLVGGHQTLRVLAELGEAEVDCVVVCLDDTHEKALNLALNKISGRWDTQRLGAVLAELDAADMTALAGFTGEEVDRLLKRAEQEIAECGELNAEDFGAEVFEHKCPRCGFLF